MRLFLCPKYDFQSKIQLRITVLTGQFALNMTQLYLVHQSDCYARFCFGLLYSKSALRMIGARHAPLGLVWRSETLCFHHWVLSSDGMRKRRVMSDRLKVVHKRASIPLFYSRPNANVSTISSTTNPAGYYTVIIITAVPLWRKKTSEKHFCGGRLCIHRLGFYIHLCLCAYASSFSLTSCVSVMGSPESERKRGGTAMGENTLSGKIFS